MNVDARLRSHKARRRALTVFSFVAATIAVLVVVAAFTVASPAADVVLDVETATLATVPAPLPETPTPAPTTTATVPPITVPPTTTTTSTTLPPEVPPTALAIGDLGISQGVLPVGLNDDGTMEVPGVSDVGWYLHGATPGHPGATVLVAHVWWGDTAGPFRRLGTLEPGARIEVAGDGDTVHEYVVVERTMYDKDALPTDLWRKSGPETLVLITCGGELNQTTRRFKQNIVVYALPTQAVSDSLELGDLPGI
jgi:hypothetical protein